MDIYRPEDIARVQNLLDQMRKLRCVLDERIAAF